MDYTKILSPVVTEVPPSGIRKYFDIAESMQGVISLGVGEPDFPTPWEIRKAGILSLEAGKTRYTANKGLEQLRVEISAYMKRKYQLNYSPTDEILVTVGGSEAIDMTLRAVICPGDEIIIPQPSYVCYEPMVRFSGGVPVILETTAEHDFKVTPEMLRSVITPRTKALIMPYPCNPTGAIMEREDLEAVAEVLRDTNILVLSDEIYAELTFGARSHVSIAAIEGMKERCVVVNGFSKTFSMTGWRMGYACGPEPIMRQVTKIHQFAIMSAPTTAQYAAIEALRHGDEAVKNMMEEYDMRRRLIVSGFNRLGLTCREPKGAFYAFPCIRSTGLTSDAFCEQLLYSQRVAVVPGTAFGAGGEGFVRASYCYSTEHIREALNRIERFLKTL
ncbi:MAG: aminotransferase class I/II-fold pyridoxal phosphate-dependent enzyme [Ruminococcaceae bacterium]|nr:aminotransferase class I/II-fold pyridoxal phosphate-dependent enzyme [Oscillospiraceae bacterium]